MITRLGYKVRYLRERASLSQAELAQILELRSKGYISEIESGKKLPPPLVILRIARHFHVTTDYLLKDELDEEDEKTRS